MWGDALRALAAHDYSGAKALAAMMQTATLTRENALDEAPQGAEVLLQTATLMEEEFEGMRERRELEDVLTSLQDAVLVVDSESRIRFVNAAAINLFDVRVEDALGAQLLEALPFFGLEVAVRAALTEGANTAQDVSLYSPTVRDVFLRVAPVRRSDGAVSGAVAIVQDFTEMRRLERVRRDFVANASHELRTPIANIRATAETILDSPDDPSLVARFLPHLVNEAERLSRLVSDLLDLARADSQGDTPRAVFNMSIVSHEVVERLNEKAVQNDIYVTCECGDTARMEGDAAAMEQVVFNLLDNALIYTPRGSQVRVATTYSEADKEIYVTVADNGAGIPADDLPRVFERFYRVDKARSRAQGGTGLGLAIVKHIVENHGGHIKVESEVGQGTTFTVTLPAAA